MQTHKEAANSNHLFRSPIQCLNPMQLQKPGEGCGLDDAELGNVSCRAEEEDKDAKYQRALHRTFR